MYTAKYFISSIILATCFSVSTVNATVTLPSVISDHMVLQRETEVSIWGWADAGEELTLEFAGQKKATRADKNGKWKIRLSPMKASAESRNMLIKGSNEIVLKDILVGEVWFCSGQSNMSWGIGRTASEEQQVFKEQKNNKHIRLFHLPAAIHAPLPAADVRADWKFCGDSGSNYFSAVGFHHGFKLYRELQVPIGLIDASVGATAVEAWTPNEGFDLLGLSYKKVSEANVKRVMEQQKLIISQMKTWLKNVEEAAQRGQIYPMHIDTRLWKWGSISNTLYNGMVAPLTQYTVKGVVWYQGEGNYGKEDYCEKMTALIKGWRKVFKYADMPFYIVQIAPYTRYSGVDQKLPETIWAAQYKAVQNLKNCGIVPTYDTLKGVINNIHPPCKQRVGERLAALALKNVYGKKVICSGPRFNKIKADGSKVRVFFSAVDQGLETSDGKAPSWFEVAGADKKFVKAAAVIKNNSIELSSPQLKSIQYVRFGWSKVAVSNLRDKNGWPVFAFGQQQVGR